MDHRVLVPAALIAASIAPQSAWAFSDRPWTARAVGERCAALARAPLDALERATRAHRPPRTPMDRARWRCMDAGDGAWIELPIAPRVAPDGRWSAARAVWFVTARGVAIAASEGSLGPYARVEDTDARQLDDRDRSAVAALVLHRRGLRPLVVRVSEDRSTVQAALADDPVALSSLEDVDDDGDLDDVHEVRLSLRERCALHDERANDPPVLSWIAARERGIAQRDGDAARAWLRIQCPSAPGAIVPDVRSPQYQPARDLPAMLRNVACARAWGASVEEVRARLPRRWPSELACVRADDLVALAQQISPPITLQPIALTATPTISALETARYGEPVLATRSLEDASARLRRACAQSTLSDRRLRALDEGALGERYGVTAFVRDAGRCARSTRGDAWLDALDPLELTRDAPQGEPTLRATLRLRHLTADGAAIEGAPVALERGVDRTEWWSVIGAHDFNGDGQSEAILEHTRDRRRATRASRISLVEVRDGQLGRYRFDPGLPSPNAVIDLDADGDRDLLDSARFALFDPSATEFVIEGPAFVAHAQRDGRFAIDDAAAQGFLRAQCPSDPSGALIARRAGGAIERPETVRRIGCARVYGARSEHLVARLIASMTADERLDPLHHALLRLTLRTAPARLR